MINKIVMGHIGNLANDARVYREAKYLTDIGFKVVIITANPFRKNDPIEWDKIDIIDLDIKKGSFSKLFYLKVYRKMFKKAIWEKANIYWAHDLDTLLPTYYAAYWNNAKIIYDSHEIFADQVMLKEKKISKAIWMFLEKKLIKKCDRVVTVNNSCAQYLSEQYNIEIPFVVRNFPEFYTADKKNILRQMFNIPTYKPICLYQGNLNYDEIDLTIDIFSKLKNCHLVFVGDGSSKKHLERQVVNKNLAQNVSFVGEVPQEMLRFYTQSADIGFVTYYAKSKSLYYSLPNKIFDYLIAGLPVVACNYPEIAKILLDNPDYGVLIDPDNIDSKISDIQRLINDEQLLQNKRRSILRSIEKFTWKNEKEKLKMIVDFKNRTPEE